MKAKKLVLLGVTMSGLVSVGVILLRSDAVNRAGFAGDSIS